MGCGAPSRHTSVTTNGEDRIGSQLSNDDDDDDDDDDDEDTPTTPIPRKALDTADIVTRQALGRIAKLGDFYDATSDKFCAGMSIFRQQLPPDSSDVSKIDKHFSAVEFAETSSLEEKFSKLNVAGDLQLSVIAGMCDAGVSATYLKQKKDSFKSVESSLISYTTTVMEQINFADDRVEEKFICQDNISRSGATHVVSEIEWGANCVITMKSENRENSDKSDIQQDLWLRWINLGAAASWVKKAISEYFGKQSQAQPQPKAQTRTRREPECIL